MTFFGRKTDNTNVSQRNAKLDLMSFDFDEKKAPAARTRPVVTMVSNYRYVIIVISLGRLRLLGLTYLMQYPCCNAVSWRRLEMLGESGSGTINAAGCVCFRWWRQNGDDDSGEESPVADSRQPDVWCHVRFGN